MTEKNHSETYNTIIQPAYDIFSEASLSAVREIKAYAKDNSTPEYNKYCSDILHIISHINQAAVNGMLGNFSMGATDVVSNIERLRTRQSSASAVLKAKFGEPVEKAAVAAIGFAEAFIKAAQLHGQDIDTFIISELAKQKTISKCGGQGIGG